jgi:hypothetical protein
LANKSRRLVGWDEILQGGLPSGTTVMSWHGTTGGVAAAKLGHDIVMTPDSYLYLDYCQFGGDDDRYEYIGGMSSLHMIYEYDPMDGIESKYQRYIIGVQGNLWNEYVWGKSDLEWKLYPRSAAVAEIGWSLLAAKDWNRFLTGLSLHELKRLGYLNRNAAPIASGIAASWAIGEIPTKWVTMHCPVTGAVDQIGECQAAFIFTGGANALQINNVKLYVDGVQVWSDSHMGIAGDPPVDNIWTLWSFLPAVVGETWITANVPCAGGGSDSSGHIYAYYAETDPGLSHSFSAWQSKMI